MSQRCPRCDRHLPGLGTWCERCGAYVADMEAAPKPKARNPKDTRSENERKTDAREAVKALGWRIHDTEQGYRPKECACGRPIPGGGTTRVPRGFPDWVLTGHGLVAFVEWKTDTNEQTEHQRAFEADCITDGVPYMVVRNTDQVVEWLRSLVEPPRAA